MSSIFSGPGAFRFMLANVVFIHHVSNLAVGRTAVYLFFCLSGYWIDRMWRDRYSRAASPYVTFIISRFWRLLPVFWAAGIIVVGIELFLKGAVCTSDQPPQQLIFSSIFILGYNIMACQPMGPAWSLDLEAQFYLVAPAIVVLIAASRNKFILLGCCALISVISAGYFGRYSILSYLVFFTFGIVYSQSDKRFSKFASAMGVYTAALIVLIIGLSPARSLVLGGSSPGPLFVYNEFLNIVLALLTVSYALHTTHLRSSRWDSMLGDLSYIVYLLHWAAVQYIGQIGGSPVHRVPYLVVAASAVYMVSYVLWRFYDRPIDALRSKWVRQRSTIGVAYPDRSRRA